MTKSMNVRGVEDFRIQHFGSRSARNDLIERWIQPLEPNSRGTGAIVHAGCAAVGHGFLVQQQFGSLYARITMEPPLYDSILQKVRNREQAHSLMMSHPAAYQFVAVQPRAPSGGGEVGGFVESIRPQPSIATHSMQVFQSF